MIDYIDGLVQDYSNSSALAMDLVQSCGSRWYTRKNKIKRMQP